MRIRIRQFAYNANYVSTIALAQMQQFYCHNGTDISTDKQIYTCLNRQFTHCEFIKQKHFRIEVTEQIIIQTTHIYCELCICSSSRDNLTATSPERF